MSKTFLIAILIFLSFIFNSSWAQDKYNLSGIIKDSETNEALIGATIMLKPGLGASADLDGKFSVRAEGGVYEALITYVGYETQKIKIKLNKNQFIEVKLTNATLDEVEIVADVAKIRETPVAFSNISQTKIAEELGGRDISMMVNSTPGAYATESGGGSGDSRVTIRGFDQKNIGVLVDGVPVNDMESGQVYWSNWSGLSEITRTMQVQRGLGASKLAIASVGGTMNIITKGIDAKRAIVLKKDWGNNNAQRMSIAYTSGFIKNKFGITLAGSYKTGDGWVDQTWTKEWSYFAKFQWKINSRHLISFGFNGSPQKHGQRTVMLPIAYYNEDFAKKMGITQHQIDSLYSQSGGYTTVTQRERGLRYTSSWGSINGGALNANSNYYHKPLLSISHFWNAAAKIVVSTSAYASFGNGGGTFTNGSFSRDTLTGQLKIQAAYDKNITNAIQKNYDPTGHPSTALIVTNENNHNWYGGLSTLTFKIDSVWTYTGGIDLRHYKGIHVGYIYDLLGGDYYIDNSRPDANMPKGQGYLTSQVKREGDRYSNRNYVGYVDWMGAFNQIEYKKKNWSAFLTANISQTNYRRIDFAKKKDVIIDGKLFKQKVGFAETFYYNGNDTLTARQYAIVTQRGDTTFVNNNQGNDGYIVGAKGYGNESENAHFSEVKLNWQLGYTVKGGANYNISTNQNVYLNFGLMQIAPRFDNVFATNNTLYNNIKPQNIQAIEIGYGFRYKKIAGNINSYYTIWNNKPERSRSVTNADGTQTNFNINGLNALHKGIELDMTFKPLKCLETDLVLSYGDWIYTNGSTAYGINDAGQTLDTVIFSAKGVHVGNAAQAQIAGGIRYQLKGFYIKPRLTYFAKNYSNFDATTLVYEYETATKKFYDLRDRDSWKMPNYALLDLSSGYEFKFEGMLMNLNLTINNLLNTIYISDAQNNGAFNSNSSYAQQTLGFNANSAAVWFGQGRRFLIGIKTTF